jgi:glycosyltransferase involved in cell wall biosynthesis
LKILILIDSLGSGGAQRQVSLLAPGLAKAGHHVEIAIYHSQFGFFEQGLVEQGIKIHKIPKRSRLSLGVVARLALLLRREKYDALITFLRTPGLYGSLMKILNPRLKFIASERSTLRVNGAKLPYHFVLQMYRFANHLVTNSHDLSDLLINEYPWMKPKIKVIYNGYVIDEQGDAILPIQVRKDGIFEFIAIGTAIDYKNYRNLVEAMIIYEREYGNSPIVRWVGRVPKAEYERIRDCNQLLDKANLGDRWVWVGERSSPDTMSMLSQSDALIHPSFFEGLSNAVCEALIAGKPVLASNVCEHPKLISRERGFLFCPDSPADIAKTIRNFVLLSVEERRLMGKNAATFAVRKLTIELAIENFEKLLTN